MKSIKCAKCGAEIIVTQKSKVELCGACIERLVNDFVNAHKSVARWRMPYDYEI